MAITVAFILMLIMITSFLAVPTVKAQRPTLNRKTYAFVGATPNPVGVGQEVLIHIGITDELAVVSDGWEGLTLTITKPDGTTETKGPFRTDSTGGTGTVYVPSVAGTYYLQTHFPAQWYNWTSYGGANVWYEASDSEKLALEVGDVPREFWPSIPLPTEYWTRPIDAQFREWSPIGGNWVTTPPNYFTPYNDGPETAHILWTKQLTQGGLAGGEMGEQAYQCGDAYQGKFSSSVIIDGILFYNRHESNGGTNIEQEVVAVDLHTGEELWIKNWNNTRLDFGQVFYWDAFNQHGVYAYLWETTGSTWNAYDPLTGRWVYGYEDVPSGTTYYGSKGEILRYYVNTNRGYMYMWNSTQAGNPSAGFGGGSWNARGTVYDGTRGIQWNVTIPTGLPGSVNQILDDRVIGSTTGTRAVQQLIQRQDEPLVFWALSTKPGQEGRLLFNKTWTPPPGTTISLTGASLEDGVFTCAAKEIRGHYGFSIDTGEKLWGPTPPQHYLDIYSILFSGRSGMIAYGKLYSSSMSGMVYAYDVKTGDLEWTYTAKDPLAEILWSDNWPLRLVFITDGKLYLGHSEHSPVDPKPRGAPFICIDAETGEEIWRIDGGFRQTDWGGRAIIGDSIIATMDTYDQRIYAIGKGPTSTSAIIRNDVLTLGSSVLIQGMVMDVSPGTKDYAIASRFPNGVPVVADESMSEWMLHVYKQFPHGDVMGVPVHVHVLDSNGNYRNIGETTTDPNGFFSLDWVPDIPGKYSVIVSFAESKAYYPSYAYTAFVVDEEIATPAPVAEPLTLPPLDMYITVGVALIIIAIAIVGLLILRKK